MNDVQFADEVMAKLRSLDGPYHQKGYLFVLAALEYAQSQLPERRHIDGAELSWACRDFAREQFGLMARTVLEHWGILRTEDFGRIVFELVDLGLLAKQSTDAVFDFEGVYDFDDALDRGYEWRGVSRSV